MHKLPRVNNNLIIENQYFPVVNWFKYSFSEKHIKILASEVYQKMSFRNRTVICGSNGLIHLSVPLEQGRNQKVVFKDVQVCYREQWQLNHWRSIFSCYGKSPFFDYYRADLEKLFSLKQKFLFDLDIAIIEWLKKVLHFTAEIAVVEDAGNFIAEEAGEDARNKWLPKNFQQGNSFIVYPQVFEDRIGFQPNVSILDILFNMGPAAATLIENAV